LKIVQEVAKIGECLKFYVKEMLRNNLLLKKCHSVGIFLLVEAKIIGLEAKNEVYEADF